MKGGLLIILFYYLLLIENGTDLIPVLLDLGNGMEIRATLIMKVLFLLSAVIMWAIKRKKHGVPKPILVFSSFLLISTIYVYFTKPSFFMAALSVNLHIQLMLSMSVYLYFNLKNEKEIYSFTKTLNTFGLINAFLVIISFFFYETFDFFEAGIKNSETVRAFGLMGDEVSIFLTFFLFEAVVTKKYKHFLVYFIAILMTGGIGAFITTVALLMYYGVFILKKSFYTYYAIIGLFIIMGLSIFLFKNQLRKIGVIKRVVNNIESPEKETGNLRIISMTTAIEMIKKRPILGTGYGSYASYVNEKYAPIFKKSGYGWKVPSAMVIIGSTFNPYLQILCEAGVIGLLFFLYFLIYIYKIIKKSKPFKYNDSLIRSKSIHLGWFIVFSTTVITANWFLPSSFLMLLIISIIGINLRINTLVIESV